MSRNPKGAPLPAARFEPATTATVEMSGIDGLEALARKHRKPDAGPKKGDRT